MVLKNYRSILWYLIVFDFNKLLSDKYEKLYFRKLIDLTKDNKNKQFWMHPIINVVVGTDFNRNIKNIISRPENYQNVYNKYVTFLGSNDFFLNTQLTELAQHGNDIELRTLFREAYQANLKSLGFNFFDTVKVFHYYDILYASGSKAGIALWRNVHKIDYNGQRELNF